MDLTIELCPGESAARRGEAPSDATASIDRCHAIRRRVFVDEQAVPANLEWDGHDGEALHLLAVSKNPETGAIRDLGTARLRVLEEEAKAERVAVVISARGMGVGRLLMEALEAHAAEAGLARIRLNAQLSAVDFYERIGYAKQGEVFVEAGIDHIAMVKLLE